MFITNGISAMKSSTTTFFFLFDKSFCIQTAAKTERSIFIFWAINPDINPHKRSPVPAVAREFEAFELTQTFPLGKEITVSLPL